MSNATSPPSPSRRLLRATGYGLCGAIAWGVLVPVFVGMVASDFVRSLSDGQAFSLLTVLAAGGAFGGFLGGAITRGRAIPRA